MKIKKLKKGEKVKKTDQNLQINWKKSKCKTNNSLMSNKLLSNKNTESNTKIEIVRTWESDIRFRLNESDRIKNILPHLKKS